jgi:hypothetical protein
MMRKVFVVAAVAALLLACDSASAASRKSGASVRKGPIAKLIELERRKNEWLRRTFLN